MCVCVYVNNKYRFFYGCVSVTLCFSAAAVLLQCTLCHPTCCSLTQSLYFSLLSFHSYFSFFLSAAHKLSRKGGATRVTRRLRLLLFLSANQRKKLEMQLFFLIQSKTLHYVSCQTQKKQLFSPVITAKTTTHTNTDA